MVIGIDASRLELVQRTGVENYAFFVIEELKNIIPQQYEVVLYSRVPLAGAAAQMPRNWRNRVLRMPGGRLWTQVRLSLEMWLHPPDVLFVPAHVMPLKGAKKTVVVIHDVAPLRFAESYSWWERMYARWTTDLALRHAAEIIVPSAFTKQEILAWFPQASARRVPIRVVAEGYGHERFNMRIARQRIGEVMEQFGIHAPYAFYVGRLEEKKDIVTLVRAYDAARSRAAQPFQLVLAGKPGYGYEWVREAIDASAYKEDICEIGYVDDAALPPLYAGAAVFVFATKYEGFGIPVLEARACGTPVVIRKGSATQELVTSTALVVDGTVESLTEALVHSICERDMRTEHARSEAGSVTTYSWARCASAVAQIIGVEYAVGSSQK